MGIGSFEDSYESWEGSAPSSRKPRIEVPEVDAADDSEKKQRCLEEVVQSLLEPGAVPDKDDAVVLASFFERIYSNGFRHDYSGVSKMILDRYSKSKKSGERGWKSSIAAGNFSEVLSSLRMQGASDKAIGGFRKLCDHVRLEDVRMSYLTDQYETLSSRLRETERKSSLLMSQINVATERMQAQQKDYIAILGVFSAVVLAFNGGISLLGSVISSVGQANPYSLLFFAAFVTEAVFGIFYILFSFVGRIVDSRPRQGVFRVFRPCGWKTVAGVNGACVGAMLASLVLRRLSDRPCAWIIALCVFALLAIILFSFLYIAPNGTTNLSSLGYGSKYITVNGRTYFIDDDDLSAIRGKRVGLLRTPFGPRLRCGRHLIKCIRSDSSVVVNPRANSDGYVARG